MTEPLINNLNKLLSMGRVFFFAVLAVFFLKASLVLGEGKSPGEALAEFAKLQKERIAQGKEPLTILDLIDMYDEGRKRKIVSKLAADGGPFFKIKGRWDLIDSAPVALSWAYHEEEPFDDNVLRVLEKIFSSSSNAEERFRIAALLYRYDKKVGKSYLLKELLGPRNVDAALILALNREAEALSSITEMFQNSSPSPALIYALGRWGQEASPILSSGLLLSNGSPFDYMRAFTMAEHRVGKATTDRIQQLYEKGQGVTKTQAAVALCVLRPDVRGPLEYLEDKLNNKQVLAQLESEIFFAIGSLSRIRALRPREILRLLVESYSSQKEPVYINPIQVEAARALLDEANGGEWSVVVEMLRKMVREKISDESDVYSIAQALYESDSKNADPILKEIFGKERITTILRIRTLRKLPKKFLPLSSQPFVGTSYSEE